MPEQKFAEVPLSDWVEISGWLWETDHPQERRWRQPGVSHDDDCTNFNAALKANDPDAVCTLLEYFLLR